MTEQLDQLDMLDFQDAVAKAEKCTKAHDFTCTEAKLAKARRVAVGTAAKNTLRLAEKNLAVEKEAVVVAKRKAEEEDETSSANRTKVCERECTGRDLYSLCLDAIWKTDYFEEIRARCSAPQQAREVETDSSPGVLAAVQGALANSRQSAAQLAGIHNQMVANLAQQDANRREAARRVSEINNRAVAAANEQAARNNAQQAAEQALQERVQAQQVAQQRADETRKTASTSSEEKDIFEPNPDFGGKNWQYGGGEATRTPVASRNEACRQAERDREQQISINAQDRRDSGVAQRSNCSCSYFARNKVWSCRVWFLPGAHSTSNSADR
ncbi:hypothetical protein [Variovorax sp. N23]|uniref:hypothetical protein n=1 Tax=Variovorax sp. N23 TaxID=2980555 RepID=UPI0021C96346|nr:hypothetical protein [Variovorax sp. N23]MCU4120159.1 hypothetical protein [Variovorax sp. N23]